MSRTYLRVAHIYFRRYFKYDFTAAIIVFLVAVPLCLGVALASGAPLYSGMISGIIGGIVVGFLSPSSVSVSGPATGMAAVVIAAVSQLNDFNTVLFALFLSGCLQIIAGWRGVGFFADYFPSSVIKGMLSAIGLLLIFKQLPLAFTLSKNLTELKFHLLEAEGSYIHPLVNLSFHINSGALFLSLLTLTSLIYFEHTKNVFLKNLPSSIMVVVLGTLLNEWFTSHHSILAQHGPHLVNIPAAYNLQQFMTSLASPNWQAWDNPMVYLYAFVFACVTSLETLLNITATEKIDKKHRRIDKNKELFAQGVGNMLAGLVGGIPITSVIIRSTVNIENKVKTKLSTILHGVFLFASFFFLADLINRIPVCILASILIYTGYKLTSPSLYIQIYQQGMIRFIPFVVTVIAVILFNILFGVLLGLAVNIFFILKYNSQARIDIIHEHYASGVTNRLILPQQTTFLNKASIVAELNSIPNRSQLIIDARYAEFIDKEITEYIQEFAQEQAPIRNISLNLIGFRDNYNIQNHINFINVSTYDAQSQLTPPKVLEILEEGNYRFLQDKGIHRSNMIDIQHTSENQHPLAIVLGCIDSRVPVETIFDMTMGDLFCVRIAGNVINDDILASIEYGCHVVGAKLIVVLGHTRCGAIQSACNHVKEGHITQLLGKIQPAIDAEKTFNQQKHGIDSIDVTQVTHLNIAHSIIEIYHRSHILQRLIYEGKIGIVGALYDVSTGKVHFSDYTPEIAVFKEYDNHALIQSIEHWYPA
jgi:carbonic anhydrase